jgi:hypothetical protein
VKQCNSCQIEDSKYYSIYFLNSKKPEQTYWKTLKQPNHFPTINSSNYNDELIQCLSLHHITLLERESNELKALQKQKGAKGSAKTKRESTLNNKLVN